MTADRTATGDTGTETVEEAPAPERRPPPDTPGAAGAPSRADSRAGAAAANDTAGEQADAEPSEEEPATAPPTGESAGEQDDGAIEDSPASTGTAQVDDGSSHRHTDTSDEADVAADDETDAGTSSAVDAADPEAERLPPDIAGSDHSGARGLTSDAQAALQDEADGDEQLAATDAAAQKEDQATEENASAEEIDLADTTASDAAADEEPLEADETPSAGEEQGDARASDVLDDAAEPPRENPVPGEDSSIAEPVGAAEDPPPAAGDQVTTGDKETPPRRLEPLDDHEYAEHARRIESKISDSLARAESTDARHTLNPERTIWHPDRAEVHQQIIDDLYSAAADVPNDGQAIIAGGLGGAGKSTTLEDHAGVDSSKYFTINPDDIKESLAKRDLIPPVEGLAPMERSALVHEESSEIARSLASRAYADRKNVIWDITMSSKSSVAKRVQQLRDSGYKNIEGIFVHIPVAKSVERAQARHRRGLENYRNGEGLGGRYVLPDVIRANADPTWGSVNRSVFEDLKPQFDKWKLYDNSTDGGEPALLESSDNSEGNKDERDLGTAR